MGKFLFAGILISSVIILGAMGNPQIRPFGGDPQDSSNIPGVESVKERQLRDRIMAPFKWEILKDFSEMSFNITTSDDPDDVFFYLYTNPSNPADCDQLKWDDDSSFKNARWISGAPIKVLMHGFTQSQNSSFPAMLKNAYLERMETTRGRSNDKYNVIVVDWGKLAGGIKSTFLPIYTKAVQNVRTAGIRVGEMVNRLTQFNIIKDLNDVHLIGFSLGAHVAGEAGRTVTDLSKNSLKVAKISGLDPAGPLFYAKIPNFNGRKLQNTDGQKVDILHTSWNSYGIAEDIGLADFHANPGRLPLQLVQTQPLCLNLLQNQMPLQVCSHNMAPVFYSMSILLKMDACKCDSRLDYINKCWKTCSQTAVLGEDWDPSQSGNYYMEIPKRIFLQSPSPISDSDDTSSTSGEPESRSMRAEPRRPKRPAKYNKNHDDDDFDSDSSRSSEESFSWWSALFGN